MSNDCECNICTEFGQLPTLTYEEGVARAERDKLTQELVNAARRSNVAPKKRTRPACGRNV
jgi:hypothetical protein